MRWSYLGSLDGGENSRAGYETIAIVIALFSIFYCMSAMMVISIASTFADVTGEHELETGLRQEGAFFAARTFCGKLTTGLGHLLAGVGMDAIAFLTGVSRAKSPRISSRSSVCWSVR